MELRSDMTRGNGDCGWDLGRVPPVVYFLAALVAGGLLHTWRPVTIGLPSLAARLGLALPAFATAAALAAWAIRVMRRAGTTIQPGGTPDALVSDGPFRRSRNPLYVALVLALAAFAPLLDSLWFAGAAILLFAVIDRRVIPREERLLSALFGCEYAAYGKRVRRWR